MAAHEFPRYQVFTKKSVPQPHPIPASLCFPWANLPTRSQTGCLPYICALLTFGKWGGIKPPSKWRRLRAVNSWIQLSNSRNCLRSMTTLHIRLFTGKLGASYLCYPTLGHSVVQQVHSAGEHLI